MSFGLARKYPHDVVEFNREKRYFVARSQPMRTINYTQYNDGSVAFDDPYVVSKRARDKLRVLVSRNAPSFSRWNGSDYV